jgi:hypothetical protein
LLVKASSRHSFARARSYPIAAKIRNAIRVRPVCGLRIRNGRSSSSSDPVAGHAVGLYASNMTGANTSTQSITSDPGRENRSSPPGPTRSRSARSRPTSAVSR